MYGVSPIDRAGPGAQYSCDLLKPFTMGVPMAGLPGQSNARILSHLFLSVTLFAGLSDFAAAHPARGGNNAYVPVNQGGYVGSPSKRAYLVASAGGTGPTSAGTH